MPSEAHSIRNKIFEISLGSWHRVVHFIPVNWVNFLMHMLIYPFRALYFSFFDLIYVRTIVILPISHLSLHPFFWIMSKALMTNKGRLTDLFRHRHQTVKMKCFYIWLRREMKLGSTTKNRRRNEVTTENRKRCVVTPLKFGDEMWLHHKVGDETWLYN